jgi:hAT family C-terminal dimerisation region
MDKLNSHLNPHMKKPYHSAIQAAMRLARKKINRYYSLTDLSSVYHITMGKLIYLSFCSHSDFDFCLVLHPGLKLEYFRQQNWEEYWISNAEHLVCEEYIISYEGKEGLKATVPDAVSHCYSTHPICLTTILQDGDSNNNGFTTFVNILVTKVVASRTSEDDRYLRKLVENVKDPLKWWIANKHVYPKLFHMVLDFLSIPGIFLSLSLFIHSQLLTRFVVATSTAVKCVFSQGRQFLSSTHNHLHPLSIHALLCLGSLGCNDFV